MLEIACFNPASALIAQKASADRIELCVGGTSPALNTLKAMQEQINIPTYVMIRPRVGGFVYDDGEIGEMRNEIERSEGGFGEWVCGWVARC